MTTDQKRFSIVSHAGVEMGEYDAETREAALDALARDAGYASHADACVALGSEADTLIITEIACDDPGADPFVTGVTPEEAEEAETCRPRYAVQIPNALAPGGWEFVRPAPNALAPEGWEFVSPRVSYADEGDAYAAAPDDGEEDGVAIYRRRYRVVTVPAGWE